jgi:carboxymethylenebutenolidase
MIERELGIATADGVMSTFVVHPEENGPFPPVIFYMDAPGRREELSDMARRLAAPGYLVVLPNLYYRRTAGFVMTSGNRAEMVAHMNSLSNAMVCADTAALLEFFDCDPAASSAPAGLVGYCMSGPFAFAAAAAFPDRVAAAASFHGVRLYTEAEDSPHKSAAGVRGELYFGCAESDEWAPPEMIARLGEHLAEVGVRHRVEWYPGTVHGFVFPERVAYHKAAAERHWERLFALFRRNLTGARDDIGATP